MTREEAVNVLYTLINSGVLDEELEESLGEIATHICNNDFEKCKGNPYCEGCVFKNN
jgi:hypothetical protein